MYSYTEFFVEGKLALSKVIIAHKIVNVVIQKEIMARIFISSSFHLTASSVKITIMFLLLVGRLLEKKKEEEEQLHFGCGEYLLLSFLVLYHDE